MTDQENSPVVQAHRRQQALRKNGDAIIHAFPPALRFKYEHKFLPEGVTFESLMRKRDEAAAEKEKFDKKSSGLLILFILLFIIDTFLMMAGATVFASSHEQSMRNVTIGAVAFLALFIIGVIMYCMGIKRDEKVSSAYQEAKKIYEIHRDDFIDLVAPILDQHGTLQIHTEAQMRAHLELAAYRELDAQDILKRSTYPDNCTAEQMEARAAAKRKAEEKSHELWKIGQLLGLGVPSKQSVYDRVLHQNKNWLK